MLCNEREYIQCFLTFWLSRPERAIPGGSLCWTVNQLGCLNFSWIRYEQQSAFPQIRLRIWSVFVLDSAWLCERLLLAYHKACWDKHTFLTYFWSNFNRQSYILLAQAFVSCIFLIFSPFPIRFIINCLSQKGGLHSIL